MAAVVLLLLLLLLLVVVVVLVLVVLVVLVLVLVVVWLLVVVVLVVPCCLNSISQGFWFQFVPLTRFPLLDPLGQCQNLIHPLGFSHRILPYRPRNLHLHPCMRCIRQSKGPTSMRRKKGFAFLRRLESHYDESAEQEYSW